MKIVITIILISCFTSAIGQNEFSKYAFLIRGKPYAGPTGNENLYGRMFTIGAEFRFQKHHSIGIDWVDFLNHYEFESADSITGYYNNNGTYNITSRRYAIIDYRYYFNNNGIYPCFYLNAFIKMGNQNRWYWDGTESKLGIPYNTSLEFKEVGLAGGGHFPFTAKDRVGLNLSLGVIRAFHLIKYGGLTTVPNSWNKGWKPHMRINFYLHFFSIK